MMLMKEIVQITLRVDVLGLLSRPLSIELLFSKQPTKSQVIEATKHFLLDKEFTSGVALKFMEAVKEIELPKVNESTDTDAATMWNETTLFFEIVEDTDEV